MLNLNIIPAELRKKPNRKPFLKTVLFVLVVLITVLAGTVAVVARGGPGRERAADVTTAAPGASSMPQQSAPPTPTGKK